MLDQPLLVEAVVQAAPAVVRVVVEVAQQVVGAEELPEVGQRRIGLHQVAVRQGPAVDGGNARDAGGGDGHRSDRCACICLDKALQQT